MQKISLVDFMEEHDLGRTDALYFAQSEGYTICTCATPIEDAMHDVSVSFALEVAHDDVALVYLTR